jgi:hypothetical protein
MLDLHPREDVRYVCDNPWWYSVNTAALERVTRSELEMHLREDESYVCDSSWWCPVNTVAQERVTRSELEMYTVGDEIYECDMSMVVSSEQCSTGECDTV